MIKSFNIKITKKSIISAIVIGVILISYMIGILVNNKGYSDNQVSLLITEIAIAVVVTLVNVKTQNKNTVIYDLIIVFFLSIIMSLCLDFINAMYFRESEQGLNYSLARFFLSLGFCFLLYLLSISIVGRIKGAVIAATIILFVAGMISYAVLELRGTRLTFADITALGTAMDVIGGYNSLPTNDYFYFSLLSFFCSIPLLFKLEKYRFKKRSIGRLALYMVFLYGFFGIFSTAFEELDYSWFEDENSYIFSFFANAKLLTLSPSIFYSPENTEEIISSADSDVSFLPSSYNADEEIKKKFPEYVQKTGSTKPNIIAVMNESLTDLGIFNEISTREVFPNIKYLNNALIGDLYTDVRGGGTADSEYSFLTGNTTLLLPNSARPYQLYVNDNTPNLVRQLEDIGYETAAIHPGVDTAWSRDIVYDTFGFDVFYWGYYFPKADYRRTETMVTDLETYNKIFELYNEKGDDPLFVFDVTIQNHGGYGQGYENLEKLAIEGDYPNDVIEFLSLMKASDNDFGELINFFSNVNEPTVILMFGDHQPKLTSNYIESTFEDESDLTLEEIQSMQVTPYVFWANYPLPTEQIGSISINYLSTILLECAGIKPSAYNTYLANLAKKIKVIDRKGIITINGGYYTYNDENIPEQYRELLDDYEDVLYYNMVDTNNIEPELFEVQEE